MTTTTTRKSLTIGGFLIGSVRIERGETSIFHEADRTFTREPSWWLSVQLGKGAGYRWIDGPGYSMNIAAPWYRKLSITGRTLSIAHHVRLSGTGQPGCKARRSWYVNLTAKGNRRPFYVPAFWS